MDENLAGITEVTLDQNFAEITTVTLGRKIWLS